MSSVTLTTENAVARAQEARRALEQHDQAEAARARESATTRLALEDELARAEHDQRAAAAAAELFAMAAAAEARATQLAEQIEERQETIAVADAELARLDQNIGDLEAVSLAAAADASAAIQAGDLDRATDLEAATVGRQRVAETLRAGREAVERLRAAAIAGSGPNDSLEALENALSNAEYDEERYRAAAENDPLYESIPEPDPNAVAASERRRTARLAEAMTPIGLRVLTDLARHGQLQVRR